MLLRTFEDVIAEVRRAIEGGRPAEAFTRVFGEMQSFVEMGGLGSTINSSPMLDELALELGRLGIRPRGRTDTGLAVIVTSDLQVGAERWRPIIDLITTDPADRFIVLTTAPDGVVEIPNQVVDASMDVETAPGELPYHRLAWLQTRLANLRPARTYVVARPLDVIAVAACQPELGGQLYYHHTRSDRPALGVHLSHAVHIDPDSASFHQCRHRGIANVHLPRLARQQPFGKTIAIRDVEALTTASAGPDFTSQSVAPIARLDLVDMVVRTLATTGGRHVHFGALSDWVLARIERRLTGAGISPSSFVYRPLGEFDAAEEISIDLFLGSVPCASPWSIADAMAAGLPLLLHDPNLPPVYCDVARAYADVPKWRTLDQLTDGLKKYDIEARRFHASRSLRHHSKKHSLSAVRRAASKILAGKPPPTPEIIIDRADPLALAHDERLRHDRGAYHDAGLNPIGTKPSELGVELVSTEPLFMGEGEQWRCCIDRAVAGYGWVELVGWAISMERVDSIEIRQHGAIGSKAKLTVLRPDVPAALPEFRAPKRCGFHIRVPQPKGSTTKWRAELALLTKGRELVSVPLTFERAR